MDVSLVLQPESGKGVCGRPGRARFGGEVEGGEGEVRDGPTATRRTRAEIAVRPHAEWPPEGWDHSERIVVCASDDGRA